MTHRTHRSLWLKYNSGFIYLFIYFWCLGFFPPAESDKISLNREKYSAPSETLCILQRFYCSLGAACEHGCNIKKEKGWGIKIHFSFSLDFKTRSRVTLSYLGSCAQCPIVRPPPLSCGLKGREGKGEEGREMEAGGITLKSSLLFPLYGNYLWAPCPLMEASSHGKGGNQINCMSVNRITSSLTCHESGLKLITHAWRTGKNGVAERRQKVWQRLEEWRGGNGRLEVWGVGGETTKKQGFPSQLGLPPPLGGSSK